MRITKLLLLAPFVLLAGCDAEPLAPYQDLVLHDQVASPTVHEVKLVARGTVTAIGWCAPGVVQISITGGGTARATGRFEEAQTACLNLATGTVTEGLATVIAANQDEIYMTWTGQARPTAPSTFDLTYVVTGGTGRFMNAEGVIDIVVEHPTPETYTATGSGWLSYYASDRSD
jgi:hypothetical protein